MLAASTDMRASTNAWATGLCANGTIASTVRLLTDLVLQCDRPRTFLNTTIPIHATSNTALEGSGLRDLGLGQTHLRLGKLHFAHRVKKCALTREEQIVLGWAESPRPFYIGLSFGLRALRFGLRGLGVSQRDIRSGLGFGLRDFGFGMRDTGGVASSLRFGLRGLGVSQRDLRSGLGFGLRGLGVSQRDLRSGLGFGLRGLGVSQRDIRSGLGFGLRDFGF